MARAGLDKNRKFLRLVRALDEIAGAMAELVARGALETLWSAAYERADDHLGDADDVEITCRWRGARGALVDRLLGAGGEGVPGFIEHDPERGGYRVHDLWEHAPPWVKKKAADAAARRSAGQTIADLRREAGKKTQFRQSTDLDTRQAVDLDTRQDAAEVTANGRSFAVQVGGKKEVGTGRDGTGRVDPPLAPPRGKRRRSEPAGGAVGEVLAALNAARRRVIDGAREIRPTPENTKHIGARLTAGNTLDDCLHVVAVCEAEVRDSPDAAQWFNAVTPFRPENFAMKVARETPSGPRIIDRDAEVFTPEQIAEGERRTIERCRQRLAAEGYPVDVQPTLSLGAVK